jgi:hypothetical protein
MPKLAFAPAANLVDWEADETGYSTGTSWVQLAGYSVGFVLFDFNFGSDLRFVDDERDRLRRWLLDEIK